MYSVYSLKKRKNATSEFYCKIGSDFGVMILCFASIFSPVPKDKGESKSSKTDSSEGGESRFISQLMTKHQIFN